METKDLPVRDHPAPAESESLIIEAEQTESAVLESLLEIRYA